MDLLKESLEAVTRLAEQFGPFLFAILFIVFVTRTANGWYKEVTTRTNPPASEREKKTYRLYFLCSVWSGIAVMALSIGWWFYNRTNTTHVYYATITGLNDNEYIEFMDPNYFYKATMRVVGERNDRIVKDYSFVVVREYPFEIGEKFYVEFIAGQVGEGGVTPVPLEIEFDGRVKHAFRLSRDGNSPRLASSGGGMDRFNLADPGAVNR